MDICKWNKRSISVLARGVMNDGREGFTLIEVMVALAIIAIALTSVFKKHGQTLSMSHSSRFYTMAPLLCQKKLSEIEQEELTKPLDESGDFGESFPGFSWRVTVERVESEALDEPFTLSRIDVTVSDEAGGMTHQLRSYRYVEEK
jgi:general secretion pathway protein I